MAALMSCTGLCVFCCISCKITSKRVVRSSAGAYAIYPPPFLVVIRVRYPKVWYRMSNPL